MITTQSINFLRMVVEDCADFRHSSADNEEKKDKAHAILTDIEAEFQDLRARCRANLIYGANGEVLGARI